MGRPRKYQKDLPPGLYCYPGRSCYIQIGAMVPVPLGTQDRDEALALYWEFRRLHDPERAQHKAQALTDRLQVAAKGGDQVTVAGYSRTWRETHLPKLLTKRGKPLAHKTRHDYGQMLEHQVERYEPFQTLAIGAAKTRHCREFLARWIGAPAYYNYVKSVLSRMFTQAVDEGLLDTNPVAGVNRRPVARRLVVCPMPDYLKITAQMVEHEARACDLVYLVSHRPGDVLRLRDEEPEIRYETREDPETGRSRKVVVVSFTATKNEQAVEIFDYVDTPGGIESALAWFRQWKTDQGFITKHVVVYPKTARKRDIGKPVSRDYLSRRFAEAVVAAGFPAGTYTLRDLRKTGLTDEARIAGKATDKGGHKTEQMKQYYVVGGVPQRARNNLVVVRAMK